MSLNDETRTIVDPGDFGQPRPDVVRCRRGTGVASLAASAARSRSSRPGGPTGVGGGRLARGAIGSGSAPAQGDGAPTLGASGGPLGADLGRGGGPDRSTASDIERPGRPGRIQVGPRPER